MNIAERGASSNRAGAAPPGRSPEERYAALAEALGEGIYEWDIANGTLWASPRLHDILGLPGRPLAPADWKRLVHPEDFPRYQAALRDCLSGATARLECECRVRRGAGPSDSNGNGTWGWVENRGVPVRDAKGQVLRLVGVIADITRRKETEEALREAQEQQTATAEVLGVINSSPGDLAPIFDAMLEKAVRLCEAQNGHLLRYENGVFSRAASRNIPAEFDRLLPLNTPMPPEFVRGSIPERMVASRLVIHVRDIREDQSYRSGALPETAAVEAGLRSALYVPLSKEGEIVGCFIMHRTVVRPFTDKQIALLQNFAAQAVIAMENVRLITETREALEQQTATAEVLQVINSSPGDLAPVFDAMLEKARTLCGAIHGDLWTYDGERFHLSATHGEPGFSAWLRQQGPLRAWPGSPNERVVRGEDYVHLLDALQDGSFQLVPEFLAQAEIAGIRTTLFIPLRKEDVLLGMIVVYRREVRAFTERQIALLQNFAAQAVIAMENARLITETREALAQQTATAEVLGVINASPGELAPVFDAILDKAHTLCGAAHGSLQLYDGEDLRAVATHSVSEAFADILRQGYRAVGSPSGRALLAGERFVHIADSATVDHPVFRSAAELSGIRTVLFVPLRKDNDLLGLISAARQEVRPFTDKQIALLENFAAQAVIAMENARLITETREALEQQTATAEILRVISSSPADLQPTFDAIAGAARMLTGASLAAVLTYDGSLMDCAASTGFTAAEVEEHRHLFPIPADRGTTTGRALLTGQVAQIADLHADPEFAYPALAEVSGAAVLAVPMLRDGVPVGAINVQRRQSGPFTDKQIDLIKTFADQAVIAMENARLINETREALEQQTATAEVLQVINSSPGDLAPVFDAMLEKAIRLCDAAFGSLWTFDGDSFHSVALRNAPAELADFIDRPYPAGPTTPLGRVARSKRIVAITDLATDEISRSGVETDREWVAAPVQLGGARSYLAIPLLKDDVLVGAFALARREVKPFTDKQIALLENFAAQAVIAMENARLLTETREALEQQTATAEVLGVINASPGDLAPVFDAMLQKAMRLCEAAFGQLHTLDGGRWHTAAMHGLPRAFAEFRARTPPIYGPGTGPARLLAGEDIVHTEDISNSEAYRLGDPSRRALVDLGGARSYIAVALRKDRELLGAITIFRQEVRPFTDKQIALLQNFAAQAVIAMENARLLTETREALEQQTATAEVLQIINSSPGNLAPVFDAILEKAHSLCGAASGSLHIAEGEAFRALAVRGMPDAFALKIRQPIQPGPRHPVSLLAAGAPYEMLTGLEEHDDPIIKQARRLADMRTALWVPLRKDDSLMGYIVASRKEVRPFSDKQITLLQNFAAQAVIAMENARLLTETRETLEQQTATAAVLQVINSSPGDLAPVFDAMLEKATRLCDASFGLMATYGPNGFRGVAAVGLPMGSADALSRIGHPPAETALGRLERTRQTVQIADISAEPAYAEVFLVNPWLCGVRTNVVVPMLKEADLVGAFIVFREEVRPFTEKQIALLQNFAAQAVIAMENARLLTETRERTRDLQESLEYQTATSDVLKVISQSTFDLEPVLRTVVETAVRMCNADKGVISLLGSDGRYRPTAPVGMGREYEEVIAQAAWAPDRGTLTGRVALEGRVVQIDDALADAELDVQKTVRAGGIRTFLGVPLLRGEQVIGVLGVARGRVEPFNEKQIALFRTFADQAVIAIENARLLNELRDRTDELARSVEELKALSEVGRAVSSTLDLRAVLSTILNRSVALAGAEAGVIFRYRQAERAFHFVEAVGYSEAQVRDVRDLSVGETVTGMGEAIARRAPLQIGDLRERPPNPLRDQALAAGYRSVLIVPLVGGDRILGATILQRRAIGEFPEATVRLMQTLAAQSVLAIQNARLFREIADKSEQLAEASRHKSQFLANMSHELRTPLNAILGYTELMADGIYGEMPARAAGVLERVQNNGKHLLALVNDVLDLSKIEAGQLTLSLEDYALPDVVRSVLSATEGMASQKGLKFTADIMPGLPVGHGDARRLAQVLLNLIGNAVKFTDAGEVTVRAVAQDGYFVLTVRDTGPGIAPEDHGKIFEEFQQVDASNTRRKGGTGLGLAISKRMVEMQGGTISVDSRLGEGATFRVILPIQVDDLPAELMGAA